MFAVTILIGCAGFYLGKLQIELPLYIDVSMTALPFYVAGFWIRRYNFFLYPSHRFDKLIPVFVVLAPVSYTHLDVYKRQVQEIESLLKKRN